MWLHDKALIDPINYSMIARLSSQMIWHTDRSSDTLVTDAQTVGFELWINRKTLNKHLKNTVGGPMPLSMLQFTYLWTLILTHLVLFCVKYQWTFGPFGAIWATSIKQKKSKVTAKKAAALRLPLDNHAQKFSTVYTCILYVLRYLQYIYLAIYVLWIRI